MLIIWNFCENSAKFKESSLSHPRPRLTRSEEEPGIKPLTVLLMRKGKYSAVLANVQLAHFLLGVQ